jgi:hypothetical protein
VKGRLPLFVILASSLAFLASLCLLWVNSNVHQANLVDFASGLG